MEEERFEPSNIAEHTQTETVEQMVEVWTTAMRQTPEDIIASIKHLACFRFEVDPSLLSKQRIVDRLEPFIEMLRGQISQHVSAETENTEACKEQQAELNRAVKDLEKARVAIAQYEADGGPLEQRFYEHLWEVASNPAGKVLLYRLMLEIRRPSTGYELEQGRDDLKRLTVTSSNKWSYDKDDMRLNIGDDKTMELTHGHVIQDPNRDSVAIDLYHELLHWFHSLVDVQRYNSHISAQNFQHLIQQYFPGPSEEWSDYLWMIAEWGGHKTTTNKYLNAVAEIEESERAARLAGLTKEVTSGEWYTTEELVTVVGSIVREQGEVARPGHELSENLYRALGRHDLRVRYGEDAVLPADQSWVRRIIETATEHINQTLKALGYGPL